MTAAPLARDLDTPLADEAGSVLARTAPFPPQRARHLRPVPMAPLQGSLPLRWSDPEPAPAPSTLPDVHAFARMLAKVLIDVLDGDRSVHHLLRLTDERVYDDLLRRTSVLANTVGNDQRLGRLRSQVISVHVSQPAAQVGEASVHVRQGSRSRAIALRIERRGARWQCTALDFG